GRAANPCQDRRNDSCYYPNLGPARLARRRWLGWMTAMWRRMRLGHNNSRIFDVGPASRTAPVRLGPPDLLWSALFEHFRQRLHLAITADASQRRFPLCHQRFAAAHFVAMIDPHRRHALDYGSQRQQIVVIGRTAIADFHVRQDEQE